MNLIVLGPPGAGKGTQADYICTEFNIAKISTGDMLRAAKHSDPAIAVLMDKGQLIPDQMIIQMLLHRIRQDDCAQGFLLDGFPRTTAQADALVNAGIRIDAVVQLIVPDEEIVKRMSGRRIHMASGRTYHTIYNPPIHANLDDVTGEPLMQRADDNEATVRKRLEVYHQQTEPLIAWYKNYMQKNNGKFFVIDGVAQVDVVRDQIKNSLSKL